MRSYRVDVKGREGQPLRCSPQALGSASGHPMRFRWAAACEVVQFIWRPTPDLLGLRVDQRWRAGLPRPEFYYSCRGGDPVIRERASPGYQRSSRCDPLSSRWAPGTDARPDPPQVGHVLTSSAFAMTEPDPSQLAHGWLSASRRRALLASTNFMEGATQAEIIAFHRRSYSSHVIFRTVSL